MRKSYPVLLAFLLVCMLPVVVNAQSFRVQCPATTSLHPNGGQSPAYNGPVASTWNFTPDGTTNQVSLSSWDEGGAIKCQQISGGDGYATMADGTQTYLFAFGPLSGIKDIQSGLPGTELNSTFDTIGDPNGAVGLMADPEAGGAITGHVDPRPIMDVGVMNGNIPAPLMAIDEDDEFFLTLTNVGMIMRPDLFEQHTVHFHGYPNASSFYDGVPDASVAINIGGSFTYYYLAPDAGTYFWHCHITPPEHLQMGMVGQIYVRPRQNRVPAGSSLYAALAGTADATCARPATPPPTSCAAIRCRPTNTVTRATTGGNRASTPTTTATARPLRRRVSAPDPRLRPQLPLCRHDLQPGRLRRHEGQVLPAERPQLPRHGHARPAADAVGRRRQCTSRSRCLRSSTFRPAARRCCASPTWTSREYQTLASLGIPMKVVALNAKLLRDQAGNNMYYNTNSITLGGGESLDVILDASDTTQYPAGSVFYLYTPNLDHLSNDAENFGGLMTEVHIN